MAFILGLLYMMSTVTTIILNSYLIIVLHRLLSEGVISWQNK